MELRPAKDNAAGRGAFLGATAKGCREQNNALGACVTVRIFYLG